MKSPSNDQKQNRLRKNIPEPDFFLFYESDQAHARGHLLVIVALEQSVNPVVGIQELAEAAVVVQGGDDVGDILAHVRLDEPFRLGEFRFPVGQVGGDDPVDDPVPVGLLKIVQSVGEQGEGTAGEYPVCFAKKQSPHTNYA